jgi:hypothetical protein
LVLPVIRSCLCTELKLGGPKNGRDPEEAGNRAAAGSGQGPVRMRKLLKSTKSLRTFLCLSFLICELGVKIVLNLMELLR